MRNLLLYAALILLSVRCNPEEGPVPVTTGMVITESTAFQPGRYELNAPDTSLMDALITVRGQNITLDFSGVEIRGANSVEWPSEFYGLCLKIEEGRNITIKNLKAKGFKVGLMATGVDSLRLIDCDFSYNYRQRLGSTREQEDINDWLSYHQNDDDEWLRYGMAVYLKECDHALVQGLQVTGGQNALMISRSNDGVFYNNTLQFNSGVGIGLYRSSRNRILHNKLDWNVRGYSHGVYARGQDSAALLCYEQSNENVFAYNSATHSGDGFFLWAGHTAMETGEGGCNDNLVYRNDFSYAPTNGVEVTFSRNRVVQNRLVGCRYGIWGGYSFGSIFAGNTIRENQFGLAIEHGQDNAVIYNDFTNNETGVQLFERNSLPAGWNYAENKDVRSRDTRIQYNAFVGVGRPLEISASDDVTVSNNAFEGFEALLKADEENPGFVFAENEVFQMNNWGAAASFRSENSVMPVFPAEQAAYWQDIVAKMDLAEELPAPLPDAMDVGLPETQLQGRAYMLVDEWGPYDFRRPSIWLREVFEDHYTFLLLGPTGNWKVVDGAGFTSINPKTGAFPAALRASPEPGAGTLRLEFEFIGEQVITQFGDTLRRGTVVPFRFQRLSLQ